MDKQQLLQTALKMQQILAAVFIASVFILIALALVIGEASGPSGGMVSIIIGVIAVIELAAAEFLPALIFGAKKPQSLEGWIAMKQVALVIESAIRESVAIMAFVIYFLNTNDFLIAAGLWGLSLLTLIIHFPTRARLEKGIPPELLR